VGFLLRVRESANALLTAKRQSFQWAVTNRRTDEPLRNPANNPGPGVVKPVSVVIPACLQPSTLGERTRRMVRFDTLGGQFNLIAYTGRSDPGRAAGDDRRLLCHGQDLRQLPTCNNPVFPVLSQQTSWAIANQLDTDACDI